MLQRKPHKVEIIRNHGLKDETIQKDVPGNIQPKTSFFEINVDIKKGDYVLVPHLEEPQIVERVDVFEGGRLEHKEVKLIPESEFLKKQDVSPININQNFHGDVENVAGRDISITNITADVYLHALQRAIADSKDIPQENKNDLIQKIVELKDNPYIISLSSAAVFESIKVLLMAS